MHIIKLGDYCYEIKTWDKTIVINPYSGQRPKTEADIVIFSKPSDQKEVLSSIGPKPFVIQGPGEYEIAGVSVFGLALKAEDNNQAKKTIYTIKAEEITLCYLDGLDSLLTEKQLEELNNTDVCFIPVDGGQVLSHKQAIAVIGQVEPKMVIPMSSRKPIEFLKEGGWETVRYEKKLKLKKSDLSEEMSMVVLE